MNSARSNVKLRGSNDLGISRICYSQKADEIKNPIKPESGDFEFQSKRYPIFKISKNWIEIG